MRSFRRIGIRHYFLEPFEGNGAVSPGQLPVYGRPPLSSSHQLAMPYDWDPRSLNCSINGWNDRAFYL